MSRFRHTRNQRHIREAEGYLELDMPEHALEALRRITEPGTLAGHALYLRGEALRAVDRYDEALTALTAAAAEDPTNVHVYLALGWCHKRTGRIDLAIDALDGALDQDPDDEERALLLYNLACYWSLAGDKDRAVSFLARSLDLDPSYREMIDDESDFDPIRGDPGFQSLTSVIV